MVVLVSLGVVFWAALMLIVAVHESGHALVAERYTSGRVTIELGKKATRRAPEWLEDWVQARSGLGLTEVYWSPRWLLAGGYCAHDHIDDRKNLRELYRAGRVRSRRWLPAVAGLTGVAWLVVWLRPEELAQPFSAITGWLAFAVSLISFALILDTVCNGVPWPTLKKQQEANDGRQEWRLKGLDEGAAIPAWLHSKTPLERGL